MQFSKMSLLAAAVALVSAQDLSQLPSCALSAALGDVQGTGCALTDIKCICLAKGLFEELSSALSSKCSADDQAKALTVAQGLCATVGVCVDDKGVSYDGACPTASSTTPAATPAETSTSAPADYSASADSTTADSSTTAAPAPSTTAAPAYGNTSATAKPSVITVYTTVLCSSSSSVPPVVTIKTTVSAKPSSPSAKPTASTVPFTGAASSNFAGAGLLSGVAALAIAMLL